MSVTYIKDRIKSLFFSKTTRLVSGVAGGNFLAMVVAVIGSLVQAQFVSPSDLGYFRSFSIATGYLFFLNLGMFDAIHRLYPFYIGKGQREKALAVAEIGQAWNTIVTLVISCGFIVLATISLISGDWRAMLAWLVQVVSISTVMYGGYLGATYRSGHDFLSVAKSSVISSVVNLFTLPFFLFWPYIALVLRNALGSIVNLVYLHIHRPLRLQLRINWKDWVALVKQGMPIFIGGYGYITFWAVVQSTLILTFLGTQSLGLWSMTLIFIEAVNKIPQALVAVYMPRVTELYGKNENIAECVSLMRKPIVVGLLGTIFMTLVGCIIIPFIVPILIPKYVEAIPTMCIMLFILPLMVLDLPNSLLIAMNKILEFNISVYVGLASFVLFALVAIWLGFNLSGVAVSSLLGVAIRISLTYWFIYSTNSGLKQVQ